MNSGETTPMWLAQGGEATIKSYEEGVPEAHKKFFRQAHLYYELENKFFVHAGILPHSPLDEQNESIFLWDRSLANMAMDAERKSLKKQFTDYKEIYIGHTPAHKLPYKACNVWLMDTGAAWDGCLSMMDIDSKEVFSSDPAPGLYPDSIGRLRL